MVNQIKYLFRVILLFSFKIKLLRRFLDFLINLNESTVFEISHNNIEMKIHTPNNVCYYRAKSFSTKEPETLQWIESFSKESVFWDIGSNIGLYSIYASLNGIKSFSFEPMPENINQLKKNVVINNLDNNIIIPLSINDISKISRMNFKSIHVSGSSHSSFYSTLDQHLNSSFDKSFQTIGISSNDFIKQYGLKPPTYVKIDVDGNEIACLKGLSEILPNIKELLVEVNKETNRKEIVEFLEKKNFKIKKTCSKGFDTKSPMQNIIFENKIN